MSDDAVISDPTRVLIVDDHQIFARSLSLMIDAEPDFEVAAVCNAGPAALAILERDPAIALILSDLYMPGDTLGASLKEMRRLAPGARIVCVTASTGLEDERLALNAGADRVVRKHADPEELLAACRGEESDGAPPAAPEPQTVSLSPRQIDVLRGLAQGRSNKQIAIDLGVSPETVKTHVSELLRRSEVSGRGELVYWARKNGVLLEL
ncbi:MAG: response regulator transcription factor [Pseudomonadota bacterium]